MRRFLRRWLDNQLLTGPGAELRTHLLEQLLGQGWALRADDSMLVNVEPVRGIPASAPFLRTTRLHPLIQADARDLFLSGKPELAVFAAMRAVEVRVRKLGGAVRAMFAGCYAMLRDPAGHRQIDYADVSEVAEAVHASSRLMRIVDRVEDRLLNAARAGASAPAA